MKSQPRQLAATPMTAITTLPASNVNLWAQRADADKTALGTTLTFGVLDHYDKAILPRSRLVQRRQYRCDLRLQP